MIIEWICKRIKAIRSSNSNRWTMSYIDWKLLSIHKNKQKSGGIFAASSWCQFQIGTVFTMCLLTNRSFQLIRLLHKLSRIIFLTLWSCMNLRSFSVHLAIVHNNLVFRIKVVSILRRRIECQAPTFWSWIPREVLCCRLEQALVWNRTKGFVTIISFHTENISRIRNVHCTIALLKFVRQTRLWNILSNDSIHTNSTNALVNSNTFFSVCSYVVWFRKGTTSVSHYIFISYWKTRQFNCFYFIHVCTRFV